MENIPLVVVLVPIFVIVLVVSFAAVRSVLNYDKGLSLVLSVCVASLSGMALAQLGTGVVAAILLPYGALGIALLVGMLILFLGRCLGRRKERRPEPTSGPTRSSDHCPTWWPGAASPKAFGQGGQGGPPAPRPGPGGVGRIKPPLPVIPTREVPKVPQENAAGSSGAGGGNALRS